MKRTVIAFSMILLFCSLALCWGCNNKSGTDSSEFDSFLNHIFCSEITANTINLHYTLKNPSAYGIDNYPVTLNSFSKETFEESAIALENYQSALNSFTFGSLTSNQQITYDILEDYFSTELSAKQLYLYSEPLNEFSGVHSQLPILLAEYRFDSEKDVKEYLTLLSLVDTYLNDIVTFEKKKSEAGLFMSSCSAEKIINHCSDFIENPDSNYLIKTFEERLDNLNDLSSKKRKKYIDANKKAISEHVIPGYKNLIAGLNSLKNTGKNGNGICYFPKGRQYYEYLVKFNTGSSRSVKEIASLIETQRRNDLEKSITIIQNNPSVLTKAQPTLKVTSPKEIVEYLKKKCEKDFPTSIPVNYSIKYVDSSLEDVLAPAYYLQPPIDNPSDNFIYINKGSLSTGLELFTTLAHEGYPGHLYQTVMSNQTSTNPLLSITDYCGYSEGWATYVEMYSYSLTGIDEDLANLLQMDRSLLLSIYSSLDIGVHYEGWKLEDVKSFMADFSITDEDTVTDIYNTVVANPAYYLRYYVGYLEFLSLRNTAMEALGDDFDLKEFHEFIINFGPGPFSVIQEYMQKWIDSQRSQS